MKTMVDIPDRIYPAIACASAASGQSVASFLVEAATEKAAVIKAIPADVQLQDWWNSFRKADPEAAAEVQQIIDEEFSKVRPEDWA